MMNRNIILILLISIFVVSCQNNKPKNDKADSENTKSDKPINVVGDWTETETNDEVKNAADFALKEIEASSEIKEILSAKTQIVSGKNYDITFSLQNGEKWNVIVYRNVKKEYQLLKSTNLKE